MNPLFKHATRAIKAAVRSEFRAGQLGRALAELESQAVGRGKAKKYLREIATKVYGQKPLPGWIDRNAGKIERYAKDNADAKIQQIIFKSLGPLGDVLQALLRPKGKRLASIDRELTAAANLLRAFGHEVIQPPSRRGGEGAKIQAATQYLENLGFHVRRKPLPGWQAASKPKPLPGWAAHVAPQTPAGGQPARKTVDLDIGAGRLNRIRRDDPLLTGAMIPVTSSNVHSIGFDINPHNAQIGTLKVRFLMDYGNSKVAGALYDYYHVPTTVFQNFRRAASKGKFVWDKLRIRGTVSGHRFDYKLTGISRGYVPRKATYTPQGEYFTKRSFLGENTRTGERRLFHSRESALVRPSANRGTEPNRGRPNRGR